MNASSRQCPVEGEGWPISTPVWDHLPVGGRTGRDGHGAGGPNKVVVACASSLARYRIVLAGAAAVLLVLTLLPTGRPDRAAAGKPGGGSGGFTVIDPTPGRQLPSPRRSRP